jgi:hypothetical protein
MSYQYKNYFPLKPNDDDFSKLGEKRKEEILNQLQEEIENIKSKHLLKSKEYSRLEIEELDSLKDTDTKRVEQEQPEEKSVEIKYEQCNYDAEERTNLFDKAKGNLLKLKDDIEELGKCHIKQKNNNFSNARNLQYEKYLFLLS